MKRILMVGLVAAMTASGLADVVVVRLRRPSALIPPEPAEYWGSESNNAYSIHFFRNDTNNPSTTPDSGPAGNNNVLNIGFGGNYPTYYTWNGIRSGCWKFEGTDVMSILGTVSDYKAYDYQFDFRQNRGGLSNVCISVWAHPQSTGSTWRAVASWYGHASANGYYWLIGTKDGNWRFSMFSAGGTYTNRIGTTILNKWVHLTVMLSRDSGCKFYTNGLVSTTTSGEDFGLRGAIATPALNGEYAIGASIEWLNSARNVEKEFDGYIDEPRIYKKDDHTGPYSDSFVSNIWWSTKERHQ